MDTNSSLARTDDTERRNSPVLPSSQLISPKPMTSIARNLSIVRDRIKHAVQSNSFNKTCTLVAVSKTKPVADLKEAYDHDQRHFGENYIQEIVEKAEQLPADIKWHFIGHIQSNKAKVLVEKVPNLYAIETIDSVKIANKVNQACELFRKEAPPLKVMVQVNTSGEDQKSGVLPDTMPQLVTHIHDNCKYLDLVGLMTIGRKEDPMGECFDSLVDCRKTIATHLGREESTLNLSMGMSNDYELAIQKGSTFVRVGSTIFGARDYAPKKSE